MINETKPDVLIVTTMDSTHHQFIIRGMELGADIITEKPMTTDEKKIQAILDAEKRTGKTCRVTFNYRYSPHRAKIWELLRAGEIGDITSVDFHWYLDTSTEPIISAAGTGSLNVAVRYGYTKPAIISTS